MPSIRLSRLSIAALLLVLSGCGLFGGGDKKEECVDTPTAPCNVDPTPSELRATGLKLSGDGSVFETAGIPFSGATLPASVDLSPDMPPPGDQGMQLSCVGWAVAYGLKTYQERVERGWSLNPSRTFSPAYVYNQLNGGANVGTYYQQALDLLKSQGVASLADMPYNSGDFRSQPSAAARAAALPYRIERWGTVNPRSVSEVKAHLSAGTPVLIGAQVDQSLQSLGPGSTWRGYAGTGRAGHAMVVVGYDDARSAFKILNSWGQFWSSGGYGWIDYTFFTQAVVEAYIALDLKGSTPAPPTPNPPTPNPPPPTPGPTLSDIIAATTVQIGTPNFNYFLNPSTPAILFSGNLSIPSGGAAGTMQFVIYFFFNNGVGGKGPPVGSLLAQYSTVTGAAATGIPVQAFPRTGLSTTWNAAIPYAAFNVQRGLPFTVIQSNLVAEFVLFVDNYAVRSFGLLPFFVRL